MVENIKFKQHTDFVFQAESVLFLCTEIANLISDAVIMGQNSESNIRARKLVIEGMSAEDAMKQVFRENLDQILQAGASGAVSGGIMGGVKAAFVRNETENSPKRGLSPNWGN